MSPYSKKCSSILCRISVRRYITGNLVFVGTLLEMISVRRYIFKMFSVRRYFLNMKRRESMTCLIWDGVIGSGDVLHIASHISHWVGNKKVFGEKFVYWLRLFLYFFFFELFVYFVDECGFGDLLSWTPAGCTTHRSSCPTFWLDYL